MQKSYHFYVFAYFLYYYVLVFKFLGLYFHWGKCSMFNSHQNSLGIMCSKTWLTFIFSITFHHNSEKWLLKIFCFIWYLMDFIQSEHWLETFSEGNHKSKLSEMGIELNMDHKLEHQQKLCHGTPLFVHTAFCNLN